MSNFLKLANQLYPESRASVVSESVRNADLPRGSNQQDTSTPLQFEFGLIAKLNDQGAQGLIESQPFALNAMLVRSVVELSQWVDRARALNAPVAVDIETTGLNFAHDRICGIALEAGGSAIYVPIAHKEGANIGLPDVAKLLTNVLSARCPKLFHNATFDVPFLMLAGFQLTGPIIDTRLLAREFHDRADRSYALKSLACEHVHPRADHWDKALAKQLKSRFRSASKARLWELSSTEVLEYACADVVLTKKLYEKLSGIVEQNIRSKTYFAMESRVSGLTAKMISAGVKVNEVALQRTISEMDRSIDDFRVRLDSAFAVGAVNYNSPKQLLKVLSDRGHSPISPKTLKPSVCADALRALDETNDLAVALLKNRTLIQNQRKQLAGVPEYLRAGRIYPHMTVSAQLGERFSCTNPTLFTGKKNPDPNETTLRQFIEPDDGHVFVFFDYSASHFRILAHLSGDEAMIDIFKSGQDFHRKVASLIFSRSYSDITDAERNRAKPLGFSVIYGMGTQGLADALGVSASRAKALKTKFLTEVFPRMGSYVSHAQRVAEASGHVLTGLFGVKIAVPREAAYKAINYQIQATESEILKVSLSRADVFLQEYKSRIALPFHDEIIFQIHKEELALIPRIKAIIEDHKLRVPIECEVALAERSWSKKIAYKCEGQERDLTGSGQGLIRQGNQTEGGLP